MLWRAIAISGRKIKPSGASYLVERQAQILDLWLIRSRCCPLSIQIDIDGGYSLPPQVVGTLVSHRARWEHLKFYFYRCPSLFLEDPMPLLRHLDFACSIPPSRLFPDAPLLRTVVLDDLDGELTLPWTQITSLTTSNLVHCQLSIAESPVELGYQFPDILLPNLESPVFIETAMYARPLYLADFLISAPSLRSLKISERALGVDPIGSLTSFVSSSGCNLQQVQITPKRAVSPGAYREAFPSVIFIFDTSDRVNEEGSQVEADPNLDIMDYFNSLAV
ncbi:hypothetical protein B0H14DRAFT_3760071 [Mycena olivaceomarginata]|nr:hypothetical protein B0H14DRAFT_3760071 [Mycena olivaceomarginata]